ncbi:acid protease [Flagelloscypha sp. PMI_526]|nr:acid protease [Flagelloscypha sp. PMI_526]
MMRLFSLLFSLLLAQQVVVASPIPFNRNPKSVTLPLTRHERSADIHPIIAMQQQINRADRRLARMTGREIDALHKRGEINKFEARYNRFRLPNNTPAAASTGAISTLVEDNDDAEVTNLKVGGADTAASGTASTASGTGGAATASSGAATGGAAASNGIGGPASDSADVTVANQPATANSLGLNIEGNDVSYSATIPIGTPPQNFLILMDSGSADFWVASENCVSQDGGDCGPHQVLGPKSSSSFQASNTPFQVTYGTGAVAGTLAQDDIDVAGLKLQAHTFGVAEQETVEFSDAGVVFDGLMGLAQSTLSQQKTLTPVEALAKAGQIDAAVVSYRIPRLADKKNDGQITFGALDTSLFDPATLVELPNVSKDGFWESAVDGITVDGQAPAIQGQRTAILDTGMISLARETLETSAVMSAVPGAALDQQAGFLVPCNTQSVVAFTFGGQEFKVQPGDLATGQQVGNGMCLAGIQSGNVGAATEWLVGDVFLKNAIFSTNVDKNIMNLAVPV